MRSHSRIVMSPAAWLFAIIVGGIAALFVLIAAATAKEPIRVSGWVDESIAAPAEVTATTSDVRAAKSAATAVIAQDAAATALEPAAIERLSMSLSQLVESGDIPPLELLEPVESAVIVLSASNEIFPGTSNEIFARSGSSLTSGLGFESSSPEFEIARATGIEAFESGWASGSSRGGAVDFSGGFAGMASPAFSGVGRGVGGGASASASARGESVLGEPSTVAARVETSPEAFRSRNDRQDGGAFSHNDGAKHDNDGVKRDDDRIKHDNDRIKRDNDGIKRDNDGTKHERDRRDAGESRHTPDDNPTGSSRSNGNHQGTGGGNSDPVSVPEPSTLLLTGTGLLGLASAVRRRTRR